MAHGPQVVADGDRAGGLDARKDTLALAFGAGRELFRRRLSGWCGQVPPPLSLLDANKKPLAHYWDERL
jgi:hypothetical protein